MGRRVLALIRHGEYAQPAGVPSAHLPYGLTERGISQARAAAAAVLDFARSSELVVDSRIDCSRLRRAWQTADLMAQALTESTLRRFECREFDELAERSVGSLANLSVEAIEAIVRDDPRYTAPPSGWKRDPEYRLPFQGCESLNQAGERVALHLRSCADALRVNAAMAAEGEPQATASLKLVVGHGGAFRHAARELGVLAPEQVASLSMDYGVPIYFDVEPSSAGPDRFVHIAGQWRQRLPGNALD